MPIKTAERNVLASLDLLASAVLVLDPQARLVFANAAAENMLESSCRLLKQQTLSDLFLNPEQLLAIFQQALEHQFDDSRQDLILERVGREPLWVDTIVTALDNPEMPVLIELRENVQQLKLEREERLIDQSQVNKELVRNLAHEIKNPLGGIRGAAQLLEREYPDTEHREYTQVIIREADRLQNLVDRLLGPNRLPQKHMVNVHQILEHVRQLVEAEAPRGIVVLRDYDPSIPEVLADREQLIQAALNVTRNALQALGVQSGGRSEGMIVLRTRTRRQVTIGGRRHRLAIQMDIEDNGPGIAPAMMEKIFYPMVTTRAEGTGLGLPIAQYLIHSHGGLIECQSQPGRTVFSMFLPLGDMP